MRLLRKLASVVLDEEDEEQEVVDDEPDEKAALACADEVGKEAEVPCRHLLFRVVARFKLQEEPVSGLWCVCERERRDVFVIS